MLQLCALVVFPALMIFAALSDLFTMTISNRVSIALVVVFFPFAWLAGMGFEDIALHLACGGGMLVLTFAMFAFGWIGGGDAKLAAATAVWIGWRHVADFGLDTTLLGGMLTLLILSVRKMPLPTWAMKVDWIARLHDAKTGIPYGIALAVAGLVIYPETVIWSAVAAS